jgi:hypothetical protein
MMNADMDERIETEKILRRMTDPRYLAERKRKKDEAKRVENIKNKHSL